MYLVADILTASRALAVVPIFLLSWYGEWRLAFIILVAAWVTDMLDGPAARRWGSLNQRSGTDEFDYHTDLLMQAGVLMTLAFVENPFQSACAVFAALVFVSAMMLGSALSMWRLVHFELRTWLPMALFAYLAFGLMGVLAVTGSLVAWSALYRGRIKKVLASLQPVEVHEVAATTQPN